MPCHKIRIAVLFVFVFIVLLLIGSIVVVAVVNMNFQRMALEEAKAKARLIQDRCLAIHAYFAHQLKPSLMSRPELTSDPNYFDPRWMSSTYAIREIHRYFRELNPGQYYYREPAVNARSPENEADPFEKRFLEQLNGDSPVEVWSGVRITDGIPYYEVLRRGEVMEGDCLRCHGDPTKAPAGLVDLYGSERSFGRSAGEVVSAISIRIPMAAARQRVRTLTRSLSVVILGVLTILFVLELLTYRRILLRPLAELRDQARRIVEDPALLGEQVRQPFGLELSELAAAFNALSRRLRDHLDGLEHTIHKRTEEMRSANRALQKFEQQVRLERDQAQRYLDLSPVIIMALDADGRVLHINRRGSELLGLSGEEICGKDWFAAFTRPAVSQEHRDVFLNTAPEDQHPFEETEIPVLTREQGERILRWRRVRIVNEGCGDQTILAVGEDISERRLLESQLASQSRLETAGTLAAGTAHVVNNLMTVVLANAEILSRRPGAEENISAIRSAAERAVRLADGLLIFGEKGTAHGTTDLNTVVGECLNEFEAGLPPGIVLIPELTPNLPLVPGDPHRLATVVRGLIDNAVDATADVIDAGGYGRILIRTGRNTEPADGREMAYLVVEDQGHGMDLPTAGRAIEPFFTTKAFGRGLGLSISYGIIKSLGGTLNLQSTVGAGTVVEVVLPTQPGLLSPRRR